MTTCYATLADAKQDNKSGTTADDLYLLRALRTVSQRIDRQMGQQSRPYFAPFIETRKLQLRPTMVNSALGTLMLPAPLLTLTGVSASGTALAVGTDLLGYPDSATPPFSALQLSADYAYDWYTFCSDTLRQPYVAITGAWGYHGDYAHAWQQVDTLAAAMSDTTTTTFTAHTVDAAGSDGNTPTFSAGMLVKVDDELMNVTTTNNTTKVVTVEARGANGSTAATHLNGAAIKVFQVEPDIRQVVARQAAFMNKKRGAYEAAVITEVGMVTYPADLLPELLGVLQNYLYT